MMDNMKDTSAHDVHNEGEGFNEMLNRLSAYDEMWNMGWSTTFYFESTADYKYRSVQIFENIRKKGIWKIETKDKDPKQETWRKQWKYDRNAKGERNKVNEKKEKVRDK